MTPAEVAVKIWGTQEGHSRGPGPRKVRVVARELFPDDAPGQGGEWDLTDAQAATIRAELTDGPKHR
jgi:hypothetical protein